MNQSQWGENEYTCRLVPAPGNPWELTNRDLAIIAKDPKAHKDERLVIYAKVAQFDSATGDCSFRGNASAVPANSFLGL